MSPSSGQKSSLQAWNHLQTFEAAAASLFPGLERSHPRAPGKTWTPHGCVNGSRTQKSPAGSSTESQGALLSPPSVVERGPSWCLQNGGPAGEWSCLYRDPPRVSGSQPGPRRRDTDLEARMEMRRTPEFQSAPYLELREWLKLL